MDSSHLSGDKVRQNTLPVGFSIQWDVALSIATLKVRPVLAMADYSVTPTVSSAKEVTLVLWKNREFHCIWVCLNKGAITAFHFYYILPAWVILHLRKTVWLRARLISARVWYVTYIKTLGLVSRSGHFGWLLPWRDPSMNFFYGSWVSNLQTGEWQHSRCRRHKQLLLWP